MFRKILVANRGEIAVRVIRAAREMGIRSVAVYSDADRRSLHVRMADETAHIGPAPSSESYLNIDSILEAARRHRADAIHPGYGFLSENASFASACRSAAIVFIGPSPETIACMGSKTGARSLAVRAGVPVLPGTEDGITNAAEARAIAERIGYPLLIKAVAGGGGKGMRRVESGEDLDSALRDAASEAERSFRSGSVYIEKYLEHPRHIEIQVLGDTHGRIIHLGERECSLQRRHQKVIEESPSPLLAQYPDLRARMGAAAVEAARAAGYYNAGTVEFLVAPDGEFYFLEMNTRLQVEHPVTELVTGLDLVHWQIRIAAGEQLTLDQEDVRWRGSAIECRLYAEDPEQNFFPSPGSIQSLALPSGPGVRLDSGVFAGCDVPTEYDPLLAKLAVWAEDRQLAIDRMARAIDECHVTGIATNIAFFRSILSDTQFRAGQIHTGFIQEWFERRGEKAACTIREKVAAIAASQIPASKPAPQKAAASKWLSEGRANSLR